MDKKRDKTADRNARSADVLHQRVTFQLTEEIRARAIEVQTLYNEIYPPGTSGWSHPQSRLLVFKCATPACAMGLATDLSELGKVIVEHRKVAFEEYWSRQESANHCRLPKDEALSKALRRIRTAGTISFPEHHEKIGTIFGVDRLIDLPGFFPTNDPSSDQLLGFLTHYVPHCLIDLVSDLARSRLRTHSIVVGQKRVIEAFLQSYSPERIVHVSFLRASDELQKTIDQAHDSLLGLLSLVISASAQAPNSKHPFEPARPAYEAPEAAPNSAEVDGTIPEIRVRVVKDDLRVTVDGTPCPLPGSEKRAVAVLALLRKRTWFSVHDFCRLYFGKQPDLSEARKDFDNPIRRLRSSIPGLTIKAEAGKRQLVGMRIVAVAKRAELEEILARLRDVQISEKDRMIIDKRDNRGR